MTPFTPIFFKEQGNNPLCSQYKMEKIILCWGSSPKLHIESLGGMFFGRTRTFGILMLNALRGTFLPPGVSQLQSHACEGTASSLSFILVPDEVAIMCGSFFLDNTQAQVEIRILGPLLVIWWTGLGSPQLNGTDYKPSCAQVT